MKKFLWILALVLGIVYVGQAKKAQIVQVAKMRERMSQGKISEEEFESYKKNSSFLKVLLDPRLVLTAD